MKKRIVSLLMSLCMSVLGPACVAHAESVPIPETRVEFAVLTEMETGRYGADDTVTALTQDGNEFHDPAPFDDCYTGDVYIVNRHTNGTETPIDDCLEYLQYVGWEVWDADVSMYEWHIWLSGNEFMFYSEW